ncbi:DUF2088 domain-containing protein [Psychrobacillus sp. INOP01]|uniref:lactate racemase domain-containing protein n=1 Tax=Psychrobacillus sp. INOP01 TaxID=2829187 RepID=UPI001BAAFD28|nr:lactate racemase domain-containing protein [Psychrobacillus sp. INOP01]QUG42586.1 DUF2088 domain-containing protein [Psychrobacillus sp. INOP01]
MIDSRFQAISELKMYKIKNIFLDKELLNLEEEILFQLAALNLSEKHLRDKKIGLTVGSRGINNLRLIVVSVIKFLKENGAQPFIIPSMGSHGGATAEGQLEVLESLGITEKSCGVPILSSMEVVKLGETKNGVPVYTDKIGYESDGVIIINRIKKHTDFTAIYESGLSKMSTIGLGNHAMAKTIHSYGVEGLKNHIKDAAEIVFNSGKILFGLAIIEDAYEHTCAIKTVHTHEIISTEPKLLEIANNNLPTLPVDEIDILVINEIGKNFSGTGMDTNVIGRINIKNQQDPLKPMIEFIIVDDLSESSHGNALGIGLADFVTEKLFHKIDFKKMNENTITTTFLKRAYIPMVLKDVHEALKTSIQLLKREDPSDLKLIQIPNTLNLEEMYVSEQVLLDMQGKKHYEVLEQLTYRDIFM